MDSNMPRNIDKSDDDQVPRRYVHVDINHRIIDSRDHVRSYTCSFCKRGFSNAQALGGHMNIHRKDRAKLRQSSDEDDKKQEIDDNNNQEVSLSLALNEQHLQVSDEEKHCLDDDDEKKRGFKIHEGKIDTLEKITELPFLVGVASLEKDKRSEEGNRSSINCEDKEEKLQVMRDGPDSDSGSGLGLNYHRDVEELDLELRLGQAPNPEVKHP